jgi:hypothetical protein
VGIQNANVGMVGLVSTDFDLSGITKLNAQPSSLNMIDVKDGLHQNVMAYIIGDVDGSFMLI